MERIIELLLVRGRVRCAALLLDNQAPLTADAVWTSLRTPRETPAWHARMAGSEVYTPGAAFVANEPPLENATVLPLPGDILYFHRLPSPQDALDARFRGTELPTGVSNIAIWYGPPQFGNLLRVETGLKAGSRFARIIEGFASWAAACEGMWRQGSVEERIRISRYEANRQVARGGFHTQ